MLTNIGLVIDRSGSMGVGMESAVEEGLSKFVKKQKEVEGNAELSLYQFDTEFEKLYSRQSLDKCLGYKLEPRGGTALYDAVGFAIKDMEEQNSKRGKIDQPDQNILVVVTDGLENSSREYTYEAMVNLIGEKTDNGWKIVFLSSEPEVVSEAYDSYYSAGNVPLAEIKGCLATFSGTPMGMFAAFDNLSCNMTSYRTTNKVGFNRKKGNN